MPIPTDEALIKFLSSDELPNLIAGLVDDVNRSEFEAASEKLSSIVNEAKETFSLTQSDISADFIQHIATLALTNSGITREQHLPLVKKLALQIESSEYFLRQQAVSSQANTFRDNFASKLFMLSGLQNALIFQIAEFDKKSPQAEDTEAYLERVTNEVANAEELTTLRDNLISAYDELPPAIKRGHPRWEDTINYLKVQKKQYQTNPSDCRSISSLFDEMTHLQTQMRSHFLLSGKTMSEAITVNQEILDFHQLPNIAELQNMLLITRCYIAEMKSRGSSPWARTRYNNRLNALVKIERQLTCIEAIDESLQKDLKDSLTTIRDNQPSLWEQPFLNLISSLFTMLFQSHTFSKKTSTGRQQGLSQQLAKTGIFKKPIDQQETSFPTDLDDDREQSPPSGGAPQSN